MSDAQLEDRVRFAILWAEHNNKPVELTIKDAKRLLYRLKKENKHVPSTKKDSKT